MFGEKPQGGFEVISVNDPAIDRGTFAAQEALIRYRESREGRPSLLVGASPTVFRCRPLPLRAVRKMEDMDEGERLVLAFRIAVVAIEGLPFAWTVKKEAGGWEEGSELLTEECVNEVSERALGEQVVREIGAVAWQRAHLSPGQKKAYALPRGYRVNLEPSSSSATDPTTRSPATGGTAS